MTQPDQRGSTVTAGIAAALAFVLPIPLGLGVLLPRLSTSTRFEGQLFGGLLDVFRRGGSNMYLTLVCALLASVVAALVLWLAARRSAELGALALLIATAPAVCAYGVLRWHVASAVSGFRLALPDDRVRLFMTTAGDETLATTLGASLTVGFAAATALGLFVAWAGHPQRAQPGTRGLVAATLVALGLVAIAWCAGGTSLSLGDALTALSQGNPQVSAMSERLAACARLGDRSSLVALITLVIGVTVLRTRPINALTLGVIGLVAIIALTATGQPTVGGSFTDGVARANSEREQLIDLEGFSTDASQGPTLKEKVDEDVLNRVKEMAEVVTLTGEPGDGLDVLLGEAVTKEVLARALELAVGAGEIELHVQHPATRSGPVLPVLAGLVNDTRRRVRVAVAWRSIECDEPCALATLEHDALLVGTERWPLETKATEPEPIELTPVLMAFTPLEPRALLTAALTATTHRSLLTLVLAGPVPEHVRRSIDFSQVVVFKGKRNADDAQTVLAHQESPPCLSRKGLLEMVPTKVRVELGITPAGKVDFVHVTNRAELRACLTPWLSSLEFAPTTEHSMISTFLTIDRARSP